MGKPVLEALAERRLKERMPVQGRADRSEYTYLEALGRLLSGMAPWLELTGLSGEAGTPQYPFWHGEADLTSKKAWAGKPFLIDKHLRES
ncbi:DUF2264 domain-containing protein [Paenibacillus sp. UNC451MF]|uniref:DUF2264 domain-containing protein n=1 Tax=Paenibacillus sp. UNC451MF TaxID=1449063 RepID=UPI00048E056F|nr:DUF2264 domain-containing protein [Paenibacillus sp. UNC451MF]